MADTMRAYYLSFSPQADGTILCRRFKDKACTVQHDTITYRNGGTVPMLSGGDLEAWEQTKIDAGWVTKPEERVDLVVSECNRAFGKKDVIILTFDRPVTEEEFAKMQTWVGAAVKVKHYG